MSAYQANIIICLKREWHNQTLRSFYQICAISHIKRIDEAGYFMPSKSNYQKSINKFGRRKNWLKKSVLNKIMAFFTNSVTALKTVVTAIGAGVAVWGIINLLEGYGNDNPGAKSQGIKQLMAGGGIVIIAQTVIPQLTSLFS